MKSLTFEAILTALSMYSMVTKLSYVSFGRIMAEDKNESGVIVLRGKSFGSIFPVSAVS